MWYQKARVAVKHLFCRGDLPNFGLWVVVDLSPPTNGIRIAHYYLRLLGKEEVFFSTQTSQKVKNPFVRQPGLNVCIQ